MQRGNQQQPLVCHPVPAHVVRFMNAPVQEGQSNANAYLRVEAPINKNGEMPRLNLDFDPNRHRAELRNSDTGFLSVRAHPSKILNQ